MPSFILLLLLPVCCWFCAPVCFPQLYIFVHCFLRISSPLFEKSWERYLCCVSPNSRWYSFRCFAARLVRRRVRHFPGRHVGADAFWRVWRRRRRWRQIPDATKSRRFEWRARSANQSSDRWRRWWYVVHTLPLHPGTVSVVLTSGYCICQSYIRILYRLPLNPGTVSVALTSGYCIGHPYIRVLYLSILHPGTVSVNLTSGYSIGCP